MLGQACVAGSMAGVAKDESINKMQLSEGPHTHVGMRLRLQKEASFY